MNSLERSLLEKAGYDNGWEQSSPDGDGGVSLSSSRHGFLVVVRKGNHDNEWSVRFMNGFPLDELKREFPSRIFSGAEVSPWDYRVLCSLLRRAAEISICVPDAPLTAFQKELDTALATQGIARGTEAERLARQRLGQDFYRKALLSYWKGACALTGVDIPELLRASHAKPWAESSDSERLNVYNGFLFSANIDLLFDTGFISFTDAGQIILSTTIPLRKFLDLNISTNSSLRWIDRMHIPFLTWHRNHVFRR